MATGSLWQVFAAGIMNQAGTAKLSGGKVATYEAGTTTPLATYSDEPLTVLHANPVILDSDGRAVIFAQAKLYKVVLSDALDNVLWTVDCWGDAGQINASSVAFNLAKNSTVFNLDNGSETTVDDVIIAPSKAVTISAARIIYVGETTGTVAAGTVQLGTTLGGVEIVAATAYQDAVGVGTVQALTIASGAVAANGVVYVRHTGVAATQAGEAFVEIEFA